MKTLTKIIPVLIILILSVSFSVAQDYKHPYGLTYKKPNTTTPSNNEKITNGKVTFVSTNGTIFNAKKKHVAGRIAKNESFVYYFKKTPALKTEQNKRCIAKGSYFPVLHENYKHPGICNYRCRE